MNKLKTTSTALAKAQQRLIGLRWIDENLDFGNGLSVSAYQTAIAAMQDSLEVYNNAQMAIAAAKQAMAAADKNLAQLNERVLVSVASKYGRDSIEYKKSGGIPSSERKRPTSRTRKTAPATSLPMPLAVSSELPPANGKAAQLALN
jgi:hypothetical protein